MEGKVTYLADL